MGFRMRKSFKVAPGVRMTVSPRGVSTSAGVRGARITKRADGRVTGTVGLPGSGISHTSTLSGSTRRTSRQRPAAPDRVPTPAVPGFFAPKWERALHKALAGDVEALSAVAQQYPEARLHVATYEAFMHALPAKNYERARELLAWVHHEGFDPSTDTFCTKYVTYNHVTIGIAEGVEVRLPLNREAIGLALAELHQQAENLDAAVVVVERLDPSTVAAVSLAELYTDQERWSDVVQLTDGLTNDDEPSTYLLTQRGHALRQLGTPGAAREALKEALRVRSRPAELRHAALIERAYCHLAERKVAMARKDLEKVLAENSRYPGLQEALRALPI